MIRLPAQFYRGFEGDRLFPAKNEDEDWSQFTLYVYVENLCRNDWDLIWPWQQRAPFFIATCWISSSSISSHLSGGLQLIFTFSQIVIQSFAIQCSLSSWLTCVIDTYLFLRSIWLVSFIVCSLDVASAITFFWRPFFGLLFCPIANGTSSCGCEWRIHTYNDRIRTRSGSLLPLSCWAY